MGSKFKTWWKEQTPGGKVGLGLGAASALGTLGVLAFGERSGCKGGRCPSFFDGGYVPAMPHGGQHWADGSIFAPAGFLAHDRYTNTGKYLGPRTEPREPETQKPFFKTRAGKIATGVAGAFTAAAIGKSLWGKDGCRGGACRDAWSRENGGLIPYRKYKKQYQDTENRFGELEVIDPNNPQVMNPEFDKIHNAPLLSRKDYQTIKKGKNLENPFGSNYRQYKQYYNEAPGLMNEISGPRGQQLSRGEWKKLSGNFVSENIPEGLDWARMNQPDGRTTLNPYDYPDLQTLPALPVSPDLPVSKQNGGDTRTPKYQKGFPFTGQRPPAYSYDIYDDAVVRDSTQLSNFWGTMTARPGIEHTLQLNREFRQKALEEIKNEEMQNGGDVKWRKLGRLQQKAKELEEAGKTDTGRYKRVMSKIFELSPPSPPEPFGLNQFDTMRGGGYAPYRYKARLGYATHPDVEYEAEGGEMVSYNPQRPPMVYKGGNVQAKAPGMAKVTGKPHEKGGVDMSGGDFVFSDHLQMNKTTISKLKSLGIEI